MIRNVFMLFAAVLVAALSFAGGSFAQSRLGRPYPPKTTISFGPQHGKNVHAYEALYDGHFDEYINTDVSDKNQATAFHLNYAPILRHAIPKATSPEYFVVGRKAGKQRAIFGSEPPDTDYSPLWQEFLVRWNSGATPVLLKSDDDVFAMQKKGKLTVHATNIVINAPVTKVGK